MNDSIYILLGSNLVDPKQNLEEARTQIAKIAKVSKSSSFYQSKPWGNFNQPDFTNQALEISYTGTAHSLLQKLQGIEHKMGRVQTEKWSARIIDIDILLFKNQIIQQLDLTVPHPFLHERKFTLIPLAEIAPNLVHPILKKNCKELLNECKDHLEVWKI